MRYKRKPSLLIIYSLQFQLKVTNLHLNKGHCSTRCLGIWELIRERGYRINDLT